MNVLLASSAIKILFRSLVILLLIGSVSKVSPAQSRPTGPCDIFSSATPCVAAFSTTRALFSSYSGPLYQVQRASDNSTSNVGVNSNGFANAAAQDSFCSGTTCNITALYDQTSNGNNLTLAPPGGNGRGAGPNGQDLPVSATALPLTAGGQKVYGMFFNEGNGYRNDSTNGIAVNGQAEGVYMVTSGIYFNGGCCFDFGNAETSNDDTGAGHMDAINIICGGGACGNPVVGLDLENGIYGGLAAGGGTIPFVTAMGTNDGQSTYTVYQGNAQSGGLSSTGSTPLPSGYTPMKQEGAIILGMGGDNSISSQGEFFEGVMTKGAPTSSVMSSVQSNIVAAGYAVLPPTPELTRYYNSSNNDHWVTIDPDPAGFSQESVLGRVLQYPASGTQAIYGCGLNNLRFVSLQSNCEGHTVLNPEGWIYASSQTNSQAVYRCYVSSTNDNFVSTDPNCEGQTYFETLGFALTQAPLVRYYNNSENLHWVSTGPVTPGFTQENVTLGYLFTVPQSGTQQLYGCVLSGLHYLSLQSNCEGSGTRVNLGTEGWIYTSSQPNTRPLYRCYVNSNNDNFVSTDSNCEGQTYFELLGYAPLQ